MTWLSCHYTVVIVLVNDTAQCTFLNTTRQNLYGDRKKYELSNINTLQKKKIVEGAGLK